MDYEKAYKEALERARKIRDEILNNEIIGFPDQITDIFPELAESESEDERIRNKIKFVFEWAETFSASGVLHQDTEDVLNWLDSKGRKSRRWIWKRS